MMYVVLLDGEFADASKLDSGPKESTWLVLSGPHSGHLVKIESAKYNCGAYYEEVTCPTCDAKFEWGNGGCHRHPPVRESGDASLKEVANAAYTTWLQIMTD